MSTEPTSGSANQSGAEPVYGPAYGAVHSRQPAPAADEASRMGFVDGASPPYTAPYPPYPSDVPTPGGLSTPVASGLAYFTIIPAVFFLLLEPYRSNTTVRFHCWQSIFYFLAVAAIRVIEMLMVSMLPSNIAFSIGSLLSILLFVAWLIAAMKAFQGSKLSLPVIGSYAEQTASTVSSR